MIQTLAEEVRLGDRIELAIQRVLPHLCEKQRFIAMFLDEARLSAHLSHANVAQVFDIGVGDNAYFVVMEYVDGADLKGVIEYLKKSGRKFPVEAAVYISAEICEGLCYAHELHGPNGQPLSVVHRAMSPPNVLLGGRADPGGQGGARRGDGAVPDRLRLLPERSGRMCHDGAT